MKGLAALCAGVMMLGASSSLFVSCDKYDDSQLKGEIEGLKGELADLEKRIKALEDDYQDQVDAMAAITALQDAVKLLGSAADVKKNADDIKGLLATIAAATGESEMSIEDIEAVLDELTSGKMTLEGAVDALGLGILEIKPGENGKTTITLSDGSKLEVMTNDNATDAVKVKEDTDGKLYWAVGGEFIEDAKGNKVPVSAVVPQVKIDPQTRKVSISVDGGDTWVETGIIDEEVAPALFSNVEKKDGYVSFTLADGEELQVALSTAATDVVFELDKLYVEYGKTETVEVEMENVAKYIVVKPEGWRVSMKDGVLSVTAPKDDNDHAEMTGLVQIFTVTADGKAAIYEFEVVAGIPQVAISLLSTGAFNVKVNNDETAKYIYGAAVLSEEITLESVYEQAIENLSDADVKSGEQKNVSIAELLGVESLAADTKYTVWAVLLDGDNGSYRAKPFDKVVSAEYVKPVITITSTPALDDADVVITATGTTGNLVFALSGVGSTAELKSSATKKDDMLNQLITAETKNVTSGGAKYLTLSEGRWEGKMIDNLYKEYTNKKINSASLKPGYTWVIIVAPEDNFTEEAIVSEFVQFNDYGYDEYSEADVTISEIKLTESSVAAKITPKDGCSYTYAIVTADVYAGLTTPEDKARKTYYQSAGNKAATKTESTATSTGLFPETDMYLLVFVCDQSGVGKLVEQKLTTTGVPYNESMELNMDLNWTGLNSADVTVTATGGEIGSIRYGIMKKADFDKKADFGETTLTLVERMAKAGDRLAVNKTVSNIRNFNNSNLNAAGKYTIENMYIMEDQYLILMAFDSENKPVKAVYAEVNTKNAFDNGFDASLIGPDVKEVYYNNNSSGYKYALDNATYPWYKMSEVTDPTTLNGKKGMYWLDLDWGTAGKPKHIWLSAANSNEWNATYPISGTDKKADATSVLKKRYGTAATANSPDFYGYNATTGAQSLTGVVISNTSEGGKYLRNQINGTETEVSAKTIHLVWETQEGKIGYMTVVPEEYLNKTPTTPDPDQPGPDEGEGGDVTPPATGDLASSPWGKIWVYGDMEMMQAGYVYVYDLGATTPGVINYGMGAINGQTGEVSVTGPATYNVSSPVVKTLQDGSTCISWEDSLGDECRIYFSDYDTEEGTAMIWSPDGGSAWTGEIGPVEQTLMSICPYPSVTYVAGGTSTGNL